LAERSVHFPGFQIAQIPPFLRHASPTTTHGYVEADLTMKAKALGKLEPRAGRSTRFRPTDGLLAFLEGL
jgi:integrase/recombinase XerD